MAEIVGYLLWLVCPLVVEGVWVVEGNVGVDEEEDSAVYRVGLGEAISFVDHIWRWVGAG